MEHKCLICEKVFNSSSALKYHTNNDVCLKEKKIYKCEICKKEFNHKGNFETHTQTKSCNSILLKNLRKDTSEKDNRINELELQLLNLQKEKLYLQNQNLYLQKELENIKSFKKKE